VADAAHVLGLKNMRQSTRTVSSDLGGANAKEHLVTAERSPSPGTRIQHTHGKNLINFDFEVAGEAVCKNRQQLLGNW
jgi:hypothetical protein